VTVRPFGAAAAGPKGLTVTGAVLGTPSYMAPEQALGDVRAVGPASDVYALGAVLYEMLTGRPPFRGTSALETLDLVRTQDAVPPSRLQPRLPRDLETICLKCLQKEPARRYASALALADDLRRFLDGRPIHARPVAAWEKAWKAARRRPLVSASLALAVVALAGLLGVWAWATVQLRAERNRASASAHDADVARGLAEANEDRAFEAIDRFLTRIADQKLASIPGLEEVRRDLLNEALATSQTFLDEKEGASPRARNEVARAHQRCVRIYAALADVDKQLEHVRHAVRLHRQLAEDFPGEPSYRVELSRDLHNLGVTVRGTAARDRLEQSEAALQEALRLRRALSEEHPDNEDYRLALAYTQQALGVTHRQQTGRQGDAEKDLQDALAILEGMPASAPASPKYRHRLANVYGSLGVLHHALGRMDQAKSSWERARDIYKGLLKDNSADEEARDGLATVTMNLGVTYLALNQPARAVEVGQEAVRTHQELARIHRGIPGYRGGLAGAHNNLGMIYEQVGNLAAAEQERRAACELARDLVRDYPVVEVFQHGLAKNLTNLGTILQMQNKDADARGPCQEAVALLEPAVRAHPEDLGLAVGMGHARFTLARAELMSAGPQPGVLERYDQAIQGLEAVCRKAPGYRESRDFLVLAYQGKMVALFLAGSYADVLATLEKVGQLGAPPNFVRRLLGVLSLAHLGTWSRAATEAREWAAAEKMAASPDGAFVLACIEARCAEAIAHDAALTSADHSRLEAEHEAEAVGLLVRRHALNGAPLPADVRKWPPRHGDDVKWKLLQPEAQLPRFAFLLARAHARAAAATPEKAGALDDLILAALRQAQAQGYFRTPDGLRRLKTEPDLKRLHALPGFQALLKDAESDSAPGGLP
jgi:tetratricopeptide (TPR) repeat protein